MPFCFGDSAVCALPALQSLLSTISFPFSHRGPSRHRKDAEVEGQRSKVNDYSVRCHE